MKQKVWVVNNIYPLVFKDDSCIEADVSKNKRKMKLDTYTRIFTNERMLKWYMENNQEHDSKFINVHEDEIEVNGGEPTSNYKVINNHELINGREPTNDANPTDGINLDRYYTVVVTEIQKAKDENGLNRVSVKLYGVTPDWKLAYRLQKSIESDYAGGHMGSGIAKYTVDVMSMYTHVFKTL